VCAYALWGNVLLDKSRHGRRLQCGVLKHPPIPLLPHSPHGIDDRTARLSLLFLWEVGDRLIPPVVKRPPAWRRWESFDTFYMDDFLTKTNIYFKKILESSLFRPLCDFVQAPPLAGQHVLRA
jgi:hypothetical protein